MSLYRFSYSTMAGVMKAVRVLQFGGPEQLKVLNDVPIPKPTASQVLVKVYAAGVNPVETYIRSGTHTIKPTLPFTPGGDFAGVVQEVGPEVKGFKKGDRVYGIRSPSGSYAQYALGNAAATFSLHDKLSYEQGAAIPVPYFTAYRALVQRCHPKPGMTVLVHGASGGVGLACCQIAQSLGLTVYGTAGTEKGLELVQQNGAQRTFSHHKEGYLDQINEATGGKGVNLVMEMLANVNLENVLKITAKHGEIAVIGSRGSIEITPRLAMTREISIHGVMSGLSTQEDILEAGAYLASGQEQGWLRPVVGQTFSLEEAPQAHEEVIAHTGGTQGKISLRVDH